MNLCDLKLNEKAKIKKINHDSSIKRRLYDLGLTKGAKIELMLISPSKCIKAYRIRDSLIAIRNKDAKKIEISGLDE